MKSKKRFCKHCGGSIDPHTKKCQQCGKQYLNKNRVITLLVCALLSIGLVCTSILCISLYQKNQTLTKRLKTAMQQITSQISSHDGQAEKEDHRKSIENHYDSIEALNMAIERNPDDFDNKIVTVDGYVSRDDKIYLWEKLFDFSNPAEVGYQLSKSSNRIAICVIFKDDTKNKTLTGDYICLTGTVTGTKGDKPYTLTNATYEMISPVE